MKKIIFLFAFLTITICFAQQSRGGQRPPQGQTNQQGGQKEIPKLESAKIAGIFEYSSKKVLKKLKLKSKDSVSKILVKHLELYNIEIRNIELANKDLFEGLDEIANQNMEAAIKKRDRDAVMQNMMMVKEKLGPIREKIKAEEEKLNTAFAATLTEDINKKWLEYQKSIKDKLKPARKGSGDERDRPNARATRGGRGR